MWFKYVHLYTIPLMFRAPRFLPAKVIQNDRNLTIHMPRMRRCFDEQQLEKNGSMDTIRAAIRRGRLGANDIVPGSVLRHFLYKSRRNVQFVMASFSPDFESPLAQRR